MVEKIMLIGGLCIVAAVICKIIGKYNKEQSVMLAIAVSAMVLGFVIVYITPVLNMVSSLYESCNINSEYSLIIFKSIGICYIGQFACDICKDCGENALCTAAEVASKAALLLLALPLFEDLIEFINKLSP